MKSTTDILSIVKTGASIMIDGATKSPTDLLSIVKAATADGQVVTLKNLNNKSTTDLLAIAKAGGIHVVLDI